MDSCAHEGRLRWHANRPQSTNLHKKARGGRERGGAGGSRGFASVEWNLEFRVRVGESWRREKIRFMVLCEVGSIRV